MPSLRFCVLGSDAASLVYRFYPDGEYLYVPAAIEEKTPCIGMSPHIEVRIDISISSPSDFYV